MDIQKFLDEQAHHNNDGQVSIENYLMVSEEGFFQSVGDVFRNIRHGRPPKLTNDKGAPMLRREVLDKTYFNSEWLSKRRFVEGDVKVGTAGKNFAGDYNVEMRKLADAWKVICSANQKIGASYYAKVKPAFVFVSEFKNRNVDALTKFVDTLDLKYTKPDFMGLDTKWDISKEGATLPALTKEQVEKLCKSIIYLCDSFFKVQGIYHPWERDFYTSLNRTWYLYSVTGAKLVSENAYPNDVHGRAACFKLINDVYTYSNMFESDYYKRKCVAWSTFELWLRGAISYIDASVR